jgi:Protein phosphatase 2C
MVTPPAQHESQRTSCSKGHTRSEEDGALTEKPTRQEWLASAASVRGKSHIDGQLPNQDSVVVLYCEPADAWVAVVSDGAGTAKRAEDGSRETTAAIAKCLLDCVAEAGTGRVDIASFTTTLEHSVEGVRALLSASGSPLHDFHCTMVACLLTRHGGHIATIGDSVALTSRFTFLPAGPQGGQTTDLFPDANTVLHEPDRGEYANETYFVTQPDWRTHLRVAMVPAQTDVVILTTDGAMDVAMTKGRVFRGCAMRSLTRGWATARRFTSPATTRRS